ncbi:MAG: hypothetical protein ACE5HK_00425 [Candidatus Methylomirabilales bacterium]
MPLLLQACPSYRPRWAKYSAEPEFDPGLLYVHLGDFAHHLVGLMKEGKTGEFSSVFDAIERLHPEGDSYIQEAAIIGFLESIQNIAGDSGVDPERFFPYLGSESASRWKRLNDFWEGKTPHV